MSRKKRLIEARDRRIRRSAGSSGRSAGPRRRSAMMWLGDSTRSGFVLNSSFIASWPISDFCLFRATTLAVRVQPVNRPSRRKSPFVQHRHRPRAPFSLTCTCTRPLCDEHRRTGVSGTESPSSCAKTTNRAHRQVAVSSTDRRRENIDRRKTLDQSALIRFLPSGFGLALDLNRSRGKVKVKPARRKHTRFSDGLRHLNRCSGHSRPASI